MRRFGVVNRCKSADLRRPRICALIVSENPARADAFHAFPNHTAAAGAYHKKGRFRKGVLFSLHKKTATEKPPIILPQDDKRKETL
jgi:hypothetical protein